MSETESMNSGQAGPSRGVPRGYIVVAGVLVVVIVVAIILLLSGGLPGSNGTEEPTAVAEAEGTATPVPTFTPGPTQPPTNTPPPPPTPTLSAPVMLDTDAPLFEFDSAGARPSTEWTGFFGQVLDAQGQPLSGVSVVVWYRDGVPASDVVTTDEQGAYEIQLAEAPLAGTWSIQVLTDDWQPASKLFTFNTDTDTTSGVQQIQVIWKRIP